MFNEVYEKRRIRSVYSPVINWAKSLPESTILKRKSDGKTLTIPSLYPEEIPQL